MPLSRKKISCAAGSNLLEEMMNQACLILAALLMVGGCASPQKDVKNIHTPPDSKDDQMPFRWMTGPLIPNEFALPEGTWANSSINECILKCTADPNCSGFSVEKKFGDGWEAGCKGGICDEKTECHAKGSFGSSPLWLPSDKIIRAPEFVPDSNTWIKDWGTLMKK